MREAEALPSEKAHILLGVSGQQKKAASQAVQEIADCLAAHGVVQPGEGFVHKQDGGRCENGPAEGCAAFHAAA